MLIAIRGHFTVEDEGAIGYVGMGREERRRLAYQSQTFSCHGCGYAGKRKASSEEEISQPLPTNVRRPSEPGFNPALAGFLALLTVAALILAINYASLQGH